VHVTPHPEAVQLLKLCGFTPSGDGRYLELGSDSSEALIEAHRILCFELEHSQPSLTPSPPSSTSSSSSATSVVAAAAAPTSSSSSSSSAPSALSGSKPAERSGSSAAAQSLPKRQPSKPPPREVTVIDDDDSPPPSSPAASSSASASASSVKPPLTSTLSKSDSTLSTSLKRKAETAPKEDEDADLALALAVSIADAEDHAKRRKLSTDSPFSPSATPSSSSSSASASASSASSASSAAASAAAFAAAQPVRTDVGFLLCRTPALTAFANRYSVSVGQLIAGDVTRAVLGNYMYELDWLVEAAPQLRSIARVDVITGDKGDGLTFLQKEIKAFPNMKLHLPHLPLSYGCHHSKFMILYYPTGVRVVIHTANYLKRDWLYKSQGVWYQDFPRRKPSTVRAAHGFGVLWSCAEFLCFRPFFAARCAF
jgi:hypothetical protein